ncbi:hypothetical protein NA78x_002738 [Anatilimnocola sp. NA78]|uniref:hypothetical protein n=1 Tax=Anatilimnocola sp. NA78 TaxID=3415683 RepID=UPI003CE4567D
MAEDTPKPKPTPFSRHLREETVGINGATVVFFRDRKKRRWCWRVVDGQVTFPSPPNSGSTSEGTRDGSE